MWCDIYTTRSRSNAHPKLAHLPQQISYGLLNGLRYHRLCWFHAPNVQSSLWTGRLLLSSWQSAHVGCDLCCVNVLIFGPSLGSMHDISCRSCPHPNIHCLGRYRSWLLPGWYSRSTFSNYDAKLLRGLLGCIWSTRQGFEHIFEILYVSLSQLQIQISGWCVDHYLRSWLFRIVCRHTPNAVR